MGATEQANISDIDWDAQISCPMNAGEVDLFQPGAQEHWYESYKILHDEQPIVQLEGEGWTPGTDAYILTKYEDIQRVVRDTDTFIQRADNGGGQSALEVEIFKEEGFDDYVDARDTLRPNLEMHKVHRQTLTDPWVGPVGADRHREMITKYANQLMDAWIDKGSVEYVADFAADLPQMVIETVIGFPLEDMAFLRECEESQVRRFVYGSGPRNLLTEDDERANAAILVDFNRYIEEKVRERRKNPTEDMISYLCQVRYGKEERPLTDGEVISVAWSMHIGGNETTRYALIKQAQALAKNPEVMETLRGDRSKVRYFVEEMLRLQAPTQGLSGRIVGKDDVVMQGVPIPKGSMLHLRYAAGNRDEKQFQNADDINLERTHPGQHLTFGQGVRSCPGAGLSRLEQNIVTNVILDRIETLEIDDKQNDFRHQPGIMLGMNELHLNFTKRKT